MTLTFEQVESHLHKWAYILENNRFEHWELINSAWAYGKVRFLPQSKIKFASWRIRQDMIDYMRKELKYRRWQTAQKSGRAFPHIYNFTDIMGRNEEESNESLVIVDKDDFMEEFEQKDLIDFVINSIFMTRLEKLIMKLYYVDEFTNEETGKVCGLHATRISQIRGNLIERLKAVNYSKAI